MKKSTRFAKIPIALALAFFGAAFSAHSEE